ARTARVGAGTRWSALVDVLDPLGLSPAIMQSNDSFTIGGSISVDCHGWQTGRPPIASSVRSMVAMTPDGVVHELSRDREPELFSLVLGGYGLFAIVIEAELQLVPNRRYQLARFVVPSAEYAEVFAREIVADGRAELAFGRLSITPGDDFLGEAILTALRPTDDQDALPPLDDAMLAGTRRLLFRASADGPAAKRLRWQAERELGALLGARTITRNSLLSEGVEVYENHSALTTDVLHEYFVPRDRFADFVVRLGDVVTEHRGNLLNVTVRDVDADPDAFLRFADQPMFALVLLFEQPRTDAGEAAMAAMTRALIDEALAVGGRFYLPYRLHATEDQLRRAYPQWDELVARKRALDPQLVLRNGLWDRYASDVLPMIQAVVAD
ncbi:MAG: FAD-binding oxidoreductase, partial [Deltaproteobacteria bacterium]|nr:FAD-binding oxidoreductase [Nannocystaceae bacterium]